MAYNYEDMSWSEVRDLFRKWREDNERKSEDVVNLWEAVLEDKQQKLGNERHLVLEQVIIAGLDSGRIDVAEMCIKNLSAEFPGSLRVQKYRAMRLEALEQYDDALDLLDAIIRKDETNAAPRKRRIAIMKARGRTGEAIKELCDYLKKFMSDQEAWHELCTLYLAEGDYAKAAFCMEEVLLHNPHSHLIHQRLGEIRYTMGGIENIEIAKSYYSQAIKLNSHNIRALYGLYLCCGHISNSKATLSKRKEAQKLGQWALAQVTEKTKKKSKNEKSSKYIQALDQAFGNLDLKSN
uniref:ER membrane protein complex subunit 2 n=1 Tax=Phlebotomus kandelakii TaxID=1109342 RepID=A0A6B2EID9_9DIPT